MCQPGRPGPTALGHDGRAYVIGGLFNNSGVSTVEAYNPPTDSWDTTGVPPLPDQRFLLAAVTGADGTAQTKKTHAVTITL